MEVGGRPLRHGLHLLMLLLTLLLLLLLLQLLLLLLQMLLQLLLLSLLLLLLLLHRQRPLLLLLQLLLLNEGFHVVGGPAGKSSLDHVLSWNVELRPAWRQRPLPSLLSHC